jgi:hypothetical protein
VKRLGVHAVVAAVLLAPSVALAKQTGIATTNCEGCHGGSGLGSPAVTITGPAQSIAAGSTVQFAVTVSGQINVGGFFLSSGQVGTFAAGTGTQLFSDGIGHASPRGAASGVVSWQIPWTAPSTPGGTELELAVLGGNGDGRSSGDRPGRSRLSIAWGCTPTTYRIDLDGDGHADPSSPTYLRCGPTAGLAAAADDCNDYDALVFPGAVEACNGRDDNCNTSIDEGLTATATWPDVDGDGYGDSKASSQLGCVSGKRAANNQDCDDTDKVVYPGAPEICDLKDDDCDGQVDEGVRVTCGKGWCGRFGPSCDAAQCVPGPPMTETCNRFDDDCDGVVDNGEPCGAGFICFEGRCYGGDTPAVDAGVDAGAMVPDAGEAVDAGEEPRPQPQQPAGCQSVPTLGASLLLLVTRAGRARRRRDPRR